jgi:hypothetical protein
MRIAFACMVLAFGLASAQGLHSAARWGTADEVAAALAAGASPDEVDDEGYTPLLLAVWHNTPAVVATLLDAGADPAFTNPKTGMGIFGLLWRNTNPIAMRALFAERELVATVGVTAPDASGPDDGRAGAEPELAPTTPPAGAPPAGPPPVDAPEPWRPPVDAPPLPRGEPVASEERPTQEAAEALGYVYRPGTTGSREEVRAWLTSRYAVAGTLTAADYLVGCRAAILDHMRERDTVLFGDTAAVTIDGEGVIRYGTYALSQGADGATRRWNLRCSGFVEHGVLHLWIEIEAR